ncbi:MULTISPECIES: RAMP superfamily CRISPR-associated protein [unclassified Microcoleus]|uniref:RAMP superfamily CRISPR-associated protein n=1 Tax=unclassified Microcoleus TaxID=2642155 RepID=UPI002FCE8DBC
MYTIRIKLLSDTTFGRGDGVAGLVDSEVEHDRYGFPYLRGRTLKGLLSEECDNLVILLPNYKQEYWLKIRNDLFGQPGSINDTIAKMHVGDACLPAGLRKAVAQQQQQDNFPTREDVINSLTAIRKQTAIASETGAPVEHSLRSMRVVVRDRPDSQPSYEAPLFFDIDPTPERLALLGVGTLALRRMGSGRNRGRGHVQCTLYYRDENITKKYIDHFGEIQ